MKIISTNLKEINLSTQFLRLETDKGELLIDIKQLLKEPVGSENAYFNATDIARHFGKDIKEFLRNKSTKEYIEELELVLNRGNSTYLKMTKTVRGRYGGGTWFHSKLFIEFAGWLDVKFKVRMHMILEEIIKQSNVLKIERENTKILFKGLTDTIKDVWIPAQDSDNGKKYAYSTLATLSNIAVLGCMSKKYATDNGIEIEKGKSIRDYLSEDVLKKIEKVEENINGFIKYGNITDYEELKEKILKD